MTDLEMPLYSKALAMAAGAHNRMQQGRKGTGTPYILHPIRVAERLRALGCGDELLAAAALHDVLEDTDMPRVKLAAEFQGTQVPRLVTAVTKKPDTTRREYLESFRFKPMSACLIKLSDRIDNLTEGGLDERFRVIYHRESAVLLGQVELNKQCRHGQAIQVLLDELRRVL